MSLKTLSFALLAGALAIAPVSDASARGRWFHHWHHRAFFGLFDAGAAVVAGAVTVATAPIAILANAASEPAYDRRSSDDVEDRYYSRRAYREDPPDAYADRRGNYGPPPGYAYGGRGYEGPPPGYYPPRASYGPPQGYAQQGYPPQGYAPQGYAPQGYARQGYAPDGYAPQGYAQQGYVQPRDDRAPPPSDDNPPPDGE